MKDKVTQNEKYPGHAEGRKGLLFAILSVVTCWFPFAGIVLGYIAMRHGEESRKLGSHLHGTLGLIVILLGGLGFFVWFEILNKKHFKKLSVYSKLVLLTTLCLLICGSVMFCIFEWNNPETIGQLSAGEKIFAGIFQSATARTAGFAGMNQSGLTDCSKAETMFLMLIGGSSGSTAGGLKTVTFVVLVMFLVSRARGKNKISVFHRTVSNADVLNAITIFSVMIVLIFFGSVFLCACDGVGLTDAAYECTSAIATVGLTTGITPSLSVYSKILLIIYMYFGRVGILTISLGFLTAKKADTEYRYAKTNLLIG